MSRWVERADPARYRESEQTPAPYIVASGEAMVSVYHTPADVPGLSRAFDTYYMCCHRCGACGRRWAGPEPAMEQAVDHLVHVHPITEGDTNVQGHSDRRADSRALAPPQDPGDRV